MDPGVSAASIHLPAASSPPPRPASPSPPPVPSLQPDPHSSGEEVLLEAQVSVMSPASLP